MSDREEGEKGTEATEWTPPLNRLFNRYRQDGVFSLLIALIDESWETEPPPALETFLKDNSTVLVIIGVFAAVIVYLLELNNGQIETLVKGMVAGAVLFGIVVGILLKNTYMAFMKAYAARSFFYSFIYMVIAMSITYMGLAMLMFFRQYPSIAGSTIDFLLIGGTIMAIFSVVFLHPKFLDPPDSFGFAPSLVYSSSGLIAASLLLPPLFYYEFYSYFPESNFLMFISMIILWAPLTFVIAKFIVLIYMAWRGVVKHSNR